MTLKAMIKERFELWCRMRRLKTMVKENDKRQKINKKIQKLTGKYNRSTYVLKRLVDEYKKIYGKDLLGDVREVKRNDR